MPLAMPVVLPLLEELDELVELVELDVLVAVVAPAKSELDTRLPPAYQAKTLMNPL
jgi:hypothetical protein